MDFQQLYFFAVAPRHPSFRYVLCVTAFCDLVHVDNGSLMM